MSRKNLDAFANLTPSQLLDAIVDDDDIEWKTDPFAMRPESANLETPDEIIAMIITFEGSPELQEQLRSLSREYIDIFSTSVRSLPSHLDTIPLKSNLPSARRSSNCWSSASSRNRRPASGVRSTLFPKAMFRGG